MNIRKRLFDRYSSKVMSGAISNYVPLSVIIIIAIGIMGIWFAIGYPRLRPLLTGLISWAVMVISINGECYIAVKLMIRPIDDEIHFFIYEDTSDIEYRCKAIVNLLYMRQHRTAPLRGTIIEDKTYPYIDNFHSYLNEPQCMLKQSDILPKEFWVQK